MFLSCDCPKEGVINQPQPKLVEISRLKPLQTHQPDMESLISHIIKLEKG